MPIPGSPVTTRTRPIPAATFPSTLAPWASSAPRSIKSACTPASPRGATDARPAPTTVKAVTGSAFPFRSSVFASFQPKSGSTSRCVASTTSTVPGEAAACSRAATLTASPSAAYSTRPPAPISPTTTRPVETPTRTPNPVTSQPRSTSRAYSSISSRTRSAARTARSGSSSWAVGAPKSASTPSPARSLIVPPKDSMAAMIRAIASPTISFSSSGSSRSARAVEPTRSANTAVTTRRSSRVEPSDPLMARILPSSDDEGGESPGVGVDRVALGDAIEPGGRDRGPAVAGAQQGARRSCRCPHRAR